MNPTILVVEDNPDVLFNIQVALEANEYEVETASNGKKAIKKLSEMGKNPDLIISDIMMPEMDGYDFFNIVSQNSVWSRIPFVFLSAKSKPEDVRFGKILGADDYITKPFD
ncbi:MAG: response regulator, partial [Candidatus Heimdallarchaeota archaeon]|nr:response regulator [Candidatus Heimdallarchaeota archaeon]